MDDVHGRSLRDSLSPCCVAAHSHSLLQLNIIACHTVRRCTCEFSTVSNLVAWKTTLRTSRAHVVTTIPRLPESDRQNTSFENFPSLLLRNTDQGVRHVCYFPTIFTQLETRTKELHMCATCSGVSRDTAQGVETCVEVSRSSHPSGTDGNGRRAVDRLCRHRRQHGWTCPQLHTFFAVRTKASNTCVQVSFYKDAWICARRTTDRDFESQRHEKANAWICA